MIIALLLTLLGGDTMLAVLVGLLGSRRHIGFGWAFLFSILLTPLIGLIIVLMSDKLPDDQHKWGCIGTLLGLFLILLLLVIGLLVVAAVL